LVWFGLEAGLGNGGHNRVEDWDRKRWFGGVGGDGGLRGAMGWLESSSDESGRGDEVRRGSLAAVGQLSILRVGEFLQYGLELRSRSGCGGSEYWTKSRSLR